MVFIVSFYYKKNKIKSFNILYFFLSIIAHYIERYDLNTANIFRPNLGTNHNTYRSIFYFFLSNI